MIVGKIILALALVALIAGTGATSLRSHAATKTADYITKMDAIDAY